MKYFMCVILCSRRAWYTYLTYLSYYAEITCPLTFGTKNWNAYTTNNFQMFLSADICMRCYHIILWDDTRHSSADMPNAWGDELWKIICKRIYNAVHGMPQRQHLNSQKTWMAVVDTIPIYFHRARVSMTGYLYICGRIFGRKKNWIGVSENALKREKGVFQEDFNCRDMGRWTANFLALNDFCNLFLCSGRAT